MSVADHPGVANPNLSQVGDRPQFEKTLSNLLGNTIGAFLNSDSEGALPTLYAATAPDAEDGGYYGPQGFQEMRGDNVDRAIVAPQARDATAATRLWQTCEDLTGIKFLFPSSTALR